MSEGSAMRQEPPPSGRARGLTLVFLLVLGAVLSLPGQEPDGNAILERMDRNLNPVSYEAYRKLINVEPNGRTKEFVLYTVKKGADKVAALFLSPASEKGRSTLRLEDNMWLYIPNVAKPIRITNLQSVVGGVFNNSDTVEKMEDLDGESVLHCKARTTAVVYDRLRIRIEKRRLLPLQIDCLTEAGMLIKTLSFKEIKDFGGGIVRPSIIETESPLYKGYKSVMIFANIKAREFEDEVFTLTFIPQLDSLRR
jgi:hypothetical protein